MADFTKTPRPFYPPLSSENREIRLLHFDPNLQNKKLTCCLSVVSLDTNPDYEALSYQWGQGTSTILVDGHSVLIPHNLEAALCTVWLSNSKRVLWADAICIDQSNIAERNEQVALMADIYKKCARCVIYLGRWRSFSESELDEESEKFHEMITSLAKKHHLDRRDAPPMPHMLGEISSPLMMLNEVGWWKRIWVVQEVVLAPESLVFFGSLEILFSDIVKAAEFIDEHDIGSAWDPNGRETDQLCHCMDWIKVTFAWANLLELRNHVFRLLELSRSKGEEEVTDVVDVLLSVRHRDSTDPRDKIFGVLSLVQEWGDWKPIKADYSKEISQVFKEFAAQMLQSTYGPKTMLLARGCDRPSSGLTNLPTWVPDWASKGSSHEQQLIVAERQNAPSQGTPSATIVGSTLALHGSLLIDRITSLSTPGVPLHRSYGQVPSMANYERYTQMLENWRVFAGMQNLITFGGVVMRHMSNDKDIQEPEERQKPEERVESGSWTRLLEDLDCSRLEKTVDFMPEILQFLDAICHYQDVLRKMDPDEEVFYRTVVHNTYPLHLREPQYHEEALCIVRLLLIFYASFSDPDRFLTRLNSVVLTKMSETLDMVQLSRKRLFRTEKGRLGIGPVEMAEGDEVYLFKGVETPFVLREIGKGVVEGKGEQVCHVLVGHCYVDGLGREELDWKDAKEIYLD